MAKIDGAHLLLLKAIQQRAKRPLLFRFVIGASNVGVAAIINRLVQLLGKDHVELSPRVEQAAYLQTFTSAEMMLDSHHHGSCNTAVDAFVTHTPNIMYEGIR